MSSNSFRLATRYYVILALFSVVLLSTRAWADDPLPPLTEIKLASSVDGTKQPSLFWAPKTAKEQPTPILVWLHSWSFNYRQKDALAYQSQAIKRGWILLLPNFRGKNDNPASGGSESARADILDALDYAQKQFDVDPNRIYLAGGSGGGHMALLMAGYHPDRFSAISAWVPIVNLADWYEFHAPPGGAERYANSVLAVCGGLPGASKAVDAEYHARSPIYHLDNVGGLHLDIAAGNQDESVPISHSLRAYNRIVATHGAEQVSDSEIKQLEKNGKLDKPLDSDQVTDPSYGCKIMLRRRAGDTRITIFEGGHVALPEACCAWLAEQQRKTKK